MNLLRRGAQQAGATGEHIHLIPGEGESTAAALTAAGPGELVVITPTDVFACWKQVTEFQRVESASRASTHMEAAE